MALLGPSKKIKQILPKERNLNVFEQKAKIRYLKKKSHRYWYDDFLLTVFRK